MVFARRDSQQTVLETLPQLFDNNLPHLALLLFDRECGVNDVEADFGGHGLILIEDMTLENPKALFDIPAKPQVHASLIILDGITATQDTSNSDIQGNAKVKAQIGP